jgi:hypothetical protein
VSCVLPLVRRAWLSLPLMVVGLRCLWGFEAPSVRVLRTFAATPSGAITRSSL